MCLVAATVGCDEQEVSGGGGDTQENSLITAWHVVLLSDPARRLPAQIVRLPLSGRLQS